MTWAVINDDGSWGSGPHDQPPDPGPAQRIVEVALGYPDVCEWSQTKGGFVDLASTATLSVGQFKLRFTQAERIAARAARSDAQVDDFLDLIDGASHGIAMADTWVRAGIAHLVSAGVLTGARAAAILAGN